MGTAKTRRSWPVLLFGFLFMGMRCAPAEAQGPAFVWPLSRSTDGSALLDRMNSPFGPRIRASTNSYEFHEGIDLAGPAGDEVKIGDPVLAAANGTAGLLTDDAGCVIRNANESAPSGCMPLFPGGGRIVRLDHGGNLYTLYLHLSRQADGLTTMPGSQTVVNAGGAIGEVGKTGMFAAIPHLHFEVRDGGVIRDFAKNPLGYLPRRVHRAPVITALSITPTGGTAEVSVTIENARDACSLAPDCDLDLNQLVVRIRDAGGTEIEARTVDSNARKNVARDNPEVNNIFIASEPFNRFDSIYRWTMVFKSLPVVSPGSYEVQAIDALGLNASGQVTLPGLSTCPRATLDELATCIRDQMPGNPNRPKTKYVPPTAAEQADFATVVTQMMNGACNFALPASLAANYQIRTFTDSQTLKSYCLLMEVLDVNSDRVVDKGWGTFIVNNNAKRRNLNHSAPHPIFDSTTENQAINIFQDTDSRSYLMCGAHRHTNGEKCTMCGAHRDTNGEECTGFCCDSHYGEADCAHQSNTMFHAAVVALNQYYASTPWTHIQWHGKKDEKCPLVDVYGSQGFNAEQFPDSNVVSLKDVMAINRPGFTFKLTGDCACDLNATDNVQGRYLNGATEICRANTGGKPTNKFVHLEQSKKIRDAKIWNLSVEQNWPIP
jgi:Peptidase family M23